MEYTNHIFIYLAALSVNLISFSTGGGYSWPSPVIPKLNGKVNPEENPLPDPLTTFEESWIAALINVGAFIGPFIAGFMSDKIGRKKTLLVFSVPMVISHLLCAFANNVHMFYIARILLGIGAGCTFSVVPNYIGEISEDKNRGLLGCFLPIMSTSGTLFNYLLGPFVSIQILSFANIIPLCLFIITFGLFVPESPYFLASIGDKCGTEMSLKKLRNRPNNEVKKEVIYITDCILTSKNNKYSFVDLFKSRGLTKGLIITCGLMVFQQFSGINAVLGYMQSIFDATGTNIPSEYCTIFIGFVQIIATAVTSQLIDRLGRKCLLIVSTMGSFLSLSTLGLYFYLKENEYNISSMSWLPITSLLIFIIAFNLGLGPLPWTIMGEVFSSNVKSLASTVTSCTCMFLGFFISMFFPYLSTHLGMAQSFWLFSAFLVTGVVFVIFRVPETKGKSLLEIQNILNEVEKE